MLKSYQQLNLFKCDCPIIVSFNHCVDVLKLTLEFHTLVFIHHNFFKISYLSTEMLLNCSPQISHASRPLEMTIQMTRAAEERLAHSSNSVLRVPAPN